MRRVKMFKLVARVVDEDDGTGRESVMELVELGEGLLHAWGVDYEELEGGAGHFTAAVVESDDGAVHLVPAMMIKFMDSAE